MTNEERIYWVGRCLRLEAEKAIAMGYSVTPPLLPIERKSLYADPPHAPGTPRRLYHHATVVDIAQMRVLRRRGVAIRAIARRMVFDESTVRRYVGDVLIEWEVSA